MFRLGFFLLALLSVAPASAAEGEFYKLDDTVRPLFVPIYSQAECLDRLRQTLYPEHSIQNGLSALFEVNNSKLNRKNMFCLDGLAKSWLNFPLPSFAGAEQRVEEVLPYLYFRENNYYLLQLQEKLRCYSDNPTGFAPTSCGGKWLSEAEAAELREKAKQETQKYEEKKKTWETESRAAHGLQRLYSKALDQITPLDLFFYLPENMKFADRPALLQMGLELSCFNPYPTEHPHHELFRSAKRIACEGKWIEQARADEIRAAVFQTLGSPEQLRERAEKEIKDRNRDRDKRLAEKNQARNELYGLHSLLSRYAIFLKNGGLPSQTADFCANHEKAQRLEKVYTESEAHRVGSDVHRYDGGPEYFSKPALDLLAKYGFTEAEVHALRNFTGEYFASINGAIREGSLRPEQQIYFEVLQSALQKLPAYNATPLKRNVTFPDGVAAEHQEGKTVCYKAYSSATKIQNWEWKGNHRLTIYPAKSARYIAPYSQHPAEEEVLLLPGSCYKVLSRRTNGNFEEIEMAEVDENGTIVGQKPVAKKKK